MDMLTRLPDLPDEALTTLHANAVRLSGAGTPKQQKAANELLPAILEEIRLRQVRKVVAKPHPAGRSRRKAAG